MHTVACPAQAFSRVAILGAGHGGRAFAAYLRLQGRSVRMWNRRWDHLPELVRTRRLRLTGRATGEAMDLVLCTSLADAVRDADLVMVITTADAHRAVMEAAAPHLKSDAWIMLHPGRTGGALEVRALLDALHPGNHWGVCESQSLVFACRSVSDCEVHVIGIKECVPVAALPAGRTSEAVALLSTLLPGLVAAPSVLHTSFENIGAILHPAIMLFNVGLIDRAQEFRFYADSSVAVADFVQRLDEERLSLGRAYGIALTSAFDWISRAYSDSHGATLLERMRFNPAYSTILGPRSFAERQITEDIPTGLVPYVSFAAAAGLELPLMRSIICISGALVGCDFWAVGRTLPRLGLRGSTAAEIWRELGVKGGQS